MSDTGWVAAIGGGALFALFLLQALRMFQTQSQFSKGFTRSFGLIFIATMAVFLVVVETTDAELTAAFTILGTIAGYLVGSQPDGSTKKTEEAADGTKVTTVKE